MKKATFILSALATTFLFTSCGGDPETETTSEDASCTYSYNEGMTSLDWTAYKTSAKVPVAGSFNSFEITAESGTDPKQVAESMSFTINTVSVETMNPERNLKIVDHFFKTINTEVISGEVKALKDDGTAIVAITMNSVTFDVKGKYKLTDRDFSFTASIDVSSWNGIPGIDALNTVCKELHTGDDGVSKLWSEVAISFSTKLKADCN